MVQGRIKRLASLAKILSSSNKQSDLFICALRDRPIPSDLCDAHHLIPKSRGGRETVQMHRACHKQIHALLRETELEQNYFNIQQLREHPNLARFIEWIRTKPSNFNPPSRRSRDKGLHKLSQ